MPPRLLAAGCREAAVVRGPARRGADVGKPWGTPAIFQSPKRWENHRTKRKNLSLPCLIIRRYIS